MREIKRAEFTIGERNCVTSVIENEEGYRFRIRTEREPERTVKYWLDREYTMGKFQNVLLGAYPQELSDEEVEYKLYERTPDFLITFDIEALKRRREIARNFLRKKQSKKKTDED